MNTDLSEKVSSKIEEICGLGCTQVNQLLDKAGNGSEIEELSDFSHSEVKQIVDELGNIMSVYDIDD
jgi:uncharacterized protein YfkK (UPF0435 family)